MLLAGVARETRTARWQWLKNKFFYEVYEYDENKKALVMSVLCAIASVGFVMSASAEDVAHGNLDEVVVEGSRNQMLVKWSTLKVLSACWVRRML